MPHGNVFISGVPLSFDVRALRELFEDFGSVISVELTEPRKMGDKRMGFVQFASEFEAHNAIAATDKKVIAGQTLEVREKEIPIECETESAQRRDSTGTASLLDRSPRNNPMERETDSVSDPKMTLLSKAQINRYLSEANIQKNEIEEWLSVRDMWYMDKGTRVYGIRLGNGGTCNRLPLNYTRFLFATYFAFRQCREEAFNWQRYSELFFKPRAVMDTAKTSRKLQTKWAELQGLVKLLEPKLSVVVDAAAVEEDLTTEDADDSDSDADLYPIPVSKEMTFSKLSDLGQFPGPLTIRVLVYKIWDLSTFISSTDNKETEVLTAIFVDEHKKAMEGSFWSTAAVYYSDRLKEGTIYYISKFGIKAVDRRYSTLPSSIRMSFGPSTTVAESELQDTSKFEYTEDFGLACVADLHNFLDLRMVSILGVVSAATQVKPKRYRNGTKYWGRTITIIDKNLESVEITLCGRIALKSEFQISQSFESKTQILLKNLRVCKYESVYCLRSDSKTEVETCIDFPEADVFAKKLSTWNENY